MIDYMIMEAILMKVKKAEADAERDAKMKEWKSRRDHLKN